MTLEEHMDEGTTAVALGHLEEALRHFKKATEWDPTCFEAWHSLGLALLKLKKYPEAVEAGKKAVELSPNDPLARVSLSMFFQRNGQIPEAEAEAAKAKILSWGGKLLPSNPGETAKPIE